MRPFANSPIWKFVDWAGDHTCINTKYIKPLFSFLWGWADKDADQTKPNLKNVEIKFGKEVGNHLYYNGVFYFRIMFPFFIGMQIRFNKDHLMQTHFGWKMNGRLGIVFRIQTDASAIAGMDFPNTDEVTQYSYGFH